VRREKGLAVFLVVTLRCRNKSINPWKKLLRAVIGVENDRYPILFSKGTNVECTRDSSCNSCRVVGVIKILSSIELNKEQLDDVIAKKKKDTRYSNDFYIPVIHQMKTE
jgi:hypothetical protein